MTVRIRAVHDGDTTPSWVLRGDRSIDPAKFARHLCIGLEGSEHWATTTSIGDHLARYGSTSAEDLRRYTAQALTQMGTQFEYEVG